MVTEKLFGQSMLMDGATRLVLRGEIALMTDGKGRSEIHVRNDDTGMVEKLVFASGAMWIPTMQLIQAIRDTHEAYDIGANVIDGSHGSCGECDGVKQITDDEGNWIPCPVCMGAKK